MSVSSQTSRIVFAGDGTSTNFSFSPYFRQQADLQLYTFVVATGVSTALVLNVDYTISGTVNPDFGYTSGGTINIPGGTTNVPTVIPVGTSIVIFRNPAVLQPLSMPTSGPLPSVPIEAEFDLATMISQRFSDHISRAVRIPDSYPGTFSGLLPTTFGLAANYGAALVVNSSGTGLTFGPVLTGAFANPMTTAGDLILALTGGTPTRLPIGSTGQVLTVVGGTATWAAASVGFVNPMTTAGDTIVGTTGGTAARLPAGTNGQVMTMVSGSPAWAAASVGFVNPMTTTGDLILGGASGTAARLGIGTNTYVLTSNGTTASWAAPSTGFSNPMTAVGDLILGGTSGAGTRLPIGANTYILTSNGTTASWAAASAGFTNPMTTPGDIIYGGTAGAATRLATGAAGLPLIAGATPSYAALGYAAGGTAATTQAGAIANIIPLTTKGDTLTYSTSAVRQAVPGDGGDLIADSTQTTGWRAASYLQTQGKPGKNYIQYADFENGATTGWSLGTAGTLTNGIPTGTPTFGSGASGTLSIAASATAPLGGGFSLSMVSTGALTAGNMLASQAYTIEPCDQSRMLMFNFNYSIPSGLSNGNFSGSSSNTYGVAIWDATNSQWIATQNFAMYASTTGANCTGTFQTNYNTASLRFCLYVINASLGAITLNTDNFYVGPQSFNYGAPMSDWIQYTPTLTGFGAPADLQAYWRRVGDTIKIKAKFTPNTGTAVEARMSFPNGLVAADTTKIGSIQAVGTGTLGVGAAISITVLSEPSVGYVTFGYMNGSQGGLTKNTGSNFSTSTLVSVYAEVPIQGWSSSVQLSSDSDNRVVDFVGAFGSQSITANTTNFSATATRDSHGVWTGTTYVVPVSGDYNISTIISVPSSGVNPRVYVNGSQLAILCTGAAASAYTPGALIAPGLKSGDIISIRADVTGTYPSFYLSINRVGNASLVAVTESVNASYWLSANFAASTTTPINFDQKEFDSHGAVTVSPTAWKFTAPVAGTYQFSSGTLELSSGTSAFYLYKNGTINKPLNYVSSAVNAAGIALVKLQAGDYVDIRITSALTVAGGAFGGSTTSFIQILRVGN